MGGFFAKIPTVALETKLMEEYNTEMISHYFVEGNANLPIPNKVLKITINLKEKINKLDISTLPICEEMIIWRGEEVFNMDVVSKEKISQFPVSDRIWMINTNLTWEHLLIRCSLVPELICDTCVFNSPYLLCNNSQQSRIEKLSLINCRLKQILPFLPQNLIYLHISLPEKGIIDFGGYLPRSLKVLSLDNTVYKIYGHLPDLTELHIGDDFMKDSLSPFIFPATLQILICSHDFFQKQQQQIPNGLQLFIIREKNGSVKTYRKEKYHRLPIYPHESQIITVK
jgi:hypothetical protein